MGNTETSTRRSITNSCVCDPSTDPRFFHELVTDDWRTAHQGNSAQQNMSNALSRVKVCGSEALSVSTRLKNEYFSSWNEKCTVTEARSVSIHNLGELISKVEDQYSGFSFDFRSRIQAIQWSSSWSHKIYEFTFGDNIDNEEVYFGMICLAKSPDGQKVDAISSLYKLDFTLAQEKVVTEDTFNLFGFIPIDTTTTVSYRTRSLGHFSKNQIANFCRLKALESFRNQGFINQISYVNSLSAVNNY
ncbi:uncharacterized protein LOC116303588 [Actinia tenebrosa]|uniref:Uncharacterized protein LOC116303588 n=1 Tax=Actinia tenebrosa TaxID=6105 RepID=A0A6P8IPN3_ACTTE|nr:uncharacterized protein LOC116303588 [Actinia tenebrosa]